MLLSRHAWLSEMRERVWLARGAKALYNAGASRGASTEKLGFLYAIGEHRCLEREKEAK